MSDPAASTPRRRAVGRFAPSPTGPLHLGSLVAAVGSFIMAKREGGLWLLRMEDIDRPRVVPGMADDILKTLAALGLHWDGEVAWQSQREEAYRAALEALRAADAAYPCGCTRKDLREAPSAPHPSAFGDEEPRYPGVCREGLPPGRPARAVRCRTPDEPIAFVDEIQGPQRWSLAETCGDFIIARADGVFAYQLAVVVDDAATGVNQVVRGADLLPSTPRQILLQRLLGLPTPRYAHLPLVTGLGGLKLSKRDNAVSVASGLDLARGGAALLARALAFLGQDAPPELAAPGAPCGELVAWAARHFDVARVPRTGRPA